MVISGKLSNNINHCQTIPQNIKHINNYQNISTITKTVRTFKFSNSDFYTTQDSFENFDNVDKFDMCFGYLFENFRFCSDGFGTFRCCFNILKLFVPPPFFHIPFCFCIFKEKTKTQNDNFDNFDKFDMFLICFGNFR